MLQSPHHDVGNVPHFRAGTLVVFPCLIFGYFYHISDYFSQMSSTIIQPIFVNFELEPELVNFSKNLFENYIK